MKTARRSPAVVVLFGAAILNVLTKPVLVAQESVPKIEGETFAGKKVVLPDACLGKVCVLIFGFSKASGAESRAWAAKVSESFKGQAGLDLYQLPVLGEVPRLVRGMVVSNIRKGVPDEQRDHFVPVLKDEASLKKFVDYREPDDAYIVVLDRTGKVVKQVHGSPAGERLENISQALSSAFK